jgi:hypothetical protein
MAGDDTSLLSRAANDALELGNPLIARSSPVGTVPSGHFVRVVGVTVKVHESVLVGPRAVKHQLCLAARSPLIAGNPNPRLWKLPLQYLDALLRPPRVHSWAPLPSSRLCLGSGACGRGDHQRENCENDRHLAWNLSG